MKRVIDMHGQQRQGGDQLDERRMFGIPAEVIALQVAVAGVEMINFVGGDGEPADARPHLCQHKHDESADEQPFPASNGLDRFRGASCFMRGHGTSVDVSVLLSVRTWMLAAAHAERRQDGSDVRTNPPAASSRRRARVSDERFVLHRRSRG